MLDETSFAEDVANELSLTGNPYGNDVASVVSTEESDYAEDVAAAINERPTGTIRVLQYNIGHFNMGMQAGNQCYIGANNATTQAYPQFFDYTTQLQRWTSRISGIDADIIGLEEYNDNFGYHSGLVSTQNSGIFNGYNLSVGPNECNNWWQNTIASKLALSSPSNVYLGSTNNIQAYLRVAKLNINSTEIWFACTHLNWNNPSGTGGASASYASRQKELKECVKWLQDKSHVILVGDFNTTGPVEGTTEERRLQGLAEFDIFLNGFTESGVTYDGGCTLANSTLDSRYTSPSTGSRPDQSPSTSPNWYLDNIIVKGFTMSNITVVDDGTITDHCGLYCDLTLIDNEQ